MCNLENAKRIAENEIKSILDRRTDLRKYKFEPVEFVRENDWYWVFAAGSKQLQSEGFAPGAILVGVDKSDGHLWTKADYDNLSVRLKNENILQAA